MTPVRDPDPLHGTLTSLSALPASSLAKAMFVVQYLDQGDRSCRLFLKPVVLDVVSRDTLCLP